jgi:hypothetical protein
MISFESWKFLHGLRYLDDTSSRELFASKITLLRGIGMVVRNVYSVIKMRQ